MKKLALVFGFLIFIGFSGFSLAKSPEMQVFVKEGMLFGYSESALVESDLSVGTLTIHYRDGSSYFWPGNSRRTQAYTLAGHEGILWLTSTERRQDHYGLMGACSTQAAAVSAAVSLVSSACAGGETVSCGAARTALDAAVSEFSNCIREFLEEY